MGVWIEIHQHYQAHKEAKSHSLRGSVDWNETKADGLGTIWGHSLRGSVDWNWIICKPLVDRAIVTPFVGVWIEMPKFERMTNFTSSHSLRGSVDWNRTRTWKNRRVGWSLPSWECGLKYITISAETEWLRRSLPSWECGLKYRCCELC